MSESMSREQFVNRVRQALGGATSQTPTPPAVDPALVRLADEGDDLAAMFAERAAAVGMAVERCAPADLGRRLVEVLAARQIKRIVSSVDDELADALQEAGIELMPWRDDRTMAADYDAGAGLTDVAAALAETGTLVCAGDGERGRGLMLVPSVHIAIVRRGDIVADMLDYMKRLEGRRPDELPAGQTLITGPSKTADIEGVLVTGVHGPGEVVVMLVDEP